MDRSEPTPPRHDAPSFEDVLLAATLDRPSAPPATPSGAPATEASDVWFALATWEPRWFGAR